MKLLLALIYSLLSLIGGDHYRSSEAIPGPLIDYRNRSFDPATGRFLQRDPVLDEGNLYNPYAGMGNNPVGNVDPMGLEVYILFREPKAGVGDFGHVLLLVQNSKTGDVRIADYYEDKRTVRHPTKKNVVVTLSDEHVSHSIFESSVNYSRPIGEWRKHRYVRFSPGPEFEAALIKEIDKGYGKDYNWKEDRTCINYVAALLKRASAASGKTGIAFKVPSLLAKPKNMPKVALLQTGKGAVMKFIRSLKNEKGEIPTEGTVDYEFIVGLDYGTLDKNNMLLKYGDKAVAELKEKLYQYRKSLAMVRERKTKLSKRGQKYVEFLQRRIKELPGKIKTLRADIKTAKTEVDKWKAGKRASPKSPKYTREVIRKYRKMVKEPVLDKELGG